MFAGWGSWVARFRWPVLSVALVAVISAGVWGLGVFGQLTEGGYQDPNSESSQAAEAVEKAFGAQGGDLVVLYTPDKVKIDDVELGKKIRTRLALLPKSAVTGTTSYWQTKSSQFAAKDKTSGIAIVTLAGADDGAKLEAFREIDDKFAVEGTKVQLSGGVVLSDATSTRSTQDLARAEIISLPVVLILLLFLFGSLVAASLPVLVGGAAVLGSLGVLHAVANVHEVNSFAVNVASLLGLGMAIDYGLFMVGRFREEQAAGRAPAEAVSRTVATAGRTVVFSASLLMIALAGLLLFPQGFLKSLAYGGLAAVGLAAVLSLTLLPAMLALLGPRVDKLPIRLPGRFSGKPVRSEESFWGRLAAAVLRRPVLFVLPILAGLLILAAPIAGVRFGEADERTLPAGDPARVAIETLKAGYPQFTGDDVPIVLRGQADTSAFAVTLRQIDGIAQLGPAQRAGDITVFTATLKSTDPFSVEARQVVDDIRSLPVPNGAELLVGGTTARNVDSLSATAAKLPWMVGMLVGATLILMFLAFGSILLPIKAVVMSALSLSATFGVLVWIFQDGHGAGFLGVTPAPLEAGIVVLMAAVVFGLSTDYEVFLLSRMVEARAHGASTPEAVTVGLARTGRVISAAALLLIVVTGAFALSSVTTMRFVGVGMIVALFLDATVVRMLLVPAVMGLLGNAVWWAPGPLKRLQERAGLAEHAGEQPALPSGRHAVGEVTAVLALPPGPSAAKKKAEWDREAAGVLLLPPGMAQALSSREAATQVIPRVEDDVVDAEIIEDDPADSDAAAADSTPTPASAGDSVAASADAADSTSTPASAGDSVAASADAADSTSTPAAASVSDNTPAGDSADAADSTSTPAAASVSDNTPAGDSADATDPTFTPAGDGPTASAGDNTSDSAPASDSASDFVAASSEAAVSSSSTSAPNPASASASATGAPTATAAPSSNLDPKSEITEKSELGEASVSAPAVAATPVIGTATDRDQPGDTPAADPKPAAAITNNEPFAAVPDDEPFAAVPDDEPIAAIADDEPVAAVPDDEPIGAVPHDEPIAAVPDDMPGAATSDDTPVAAAPDDEPVAAIPDAEPIAAVPDGGPVAAFGEDEAVAAVSDDAPAAAVPDDRLVDAASYPAYEEPVAADEAEVVDAELVEPDPPLAAASLNLPVPFYPEPGVYRSESVSKYTDYSAPDDFFFGPSAAGTFASSLELPAEPPVPYFGDRPDFEPAASVSLPELDLTRSFDAPDLDATAIFEAPNREAVRAFESPDPETSGVIVTPESDPVSRPEPAEEPVSAGDDADPAVTRSFDAPDLDATRRLTLPGLESTRRMAAPDIARARRLESSAPPAEPKTPSKPSTPIIPGTPTAPPVPVASAEPVADPRAESVAEPAASPGAESVAKPVAEPLPKRPVRPAEPPSSSLIEPPTSGSGTASRLSDLFPARRTSEPTPPPVQRRPTIFDEPAPVPEDPGPAPYDGPLPRRTAQPAPQRRAGDPLPKRRPAESLPKRPVTEPAATRPATEPAANTRPVTEPAANTRPVTEPAANTRPVTEPAASTPPVREPLPRRQVGEQPLPVRKQAEPPVPQAPAVPAQRRPADLGDHLRTTRPADLGDHLRETRPADLAQYTRRPTTERKRPESLAEHKPARRPATLADQVTSPRRKPEGDEPAE
ncbi:MMPL family transporter [Paractinoplanes lichenicola]|uniref:MMPL family transporter n=1 Tax=Paractinoplanes lichenicola TaxID=2802976 RepID=UPI0027DE3855|nr:MMPL family transporter [Actinoplanes lichenicola]